MRKPSEAYANLQTVSQSFSMMRTNGMVAKRLECVDTAASQGSCLGRTSDLFIGSIVCSHLLFKVACFRSTGIAEHFLRCLGSFAVMVRIVLWHCVCIVVGMHRSRC